MSRVQFTARILRLLLCFVQWTVARIWPRWRLVSLDGTSTVQSYICVANVYPHAKGLKEQKGHAFSPIVLRYICVTVLLYVARLSDWCNTAVKNAVGHSETSQ